MRTLIPATAILAAVATLALAGCGPARPTPEQEDAMRAEHYRIIAAQRAAMTPEQRLAADQAMAERVTRDMQVNSWDR